MRIPVTVPRVPNDRGADTLGRMRASDDARGAHPSAPPPVGTPTGLQPAGTPNHADRASAAELLSVLDAVFRNAPVGIAIVDSDLRYVHVSDALAERIGVPPAELIGRRVDEAAGPLGAAIAAEIQWVFASGKPVQDREFVGPGGPHGERRIWTTTFYPVPDANGETVFVGAVVIDATRRREAEAEREFLLAAEHEARAQAEQARRRLEFMLEVSTVLSSTLDHELAMRRLARLAVPVLADVCLIDSLEENGEIRRMAAVHADPDRRVSMHELAVRPPDPNGSHPIVEVLRTGHSMIGADMGESFLRAASRDDEHYAAVRALGFESYMCLPLLSGTRVVGTLTLVSAGSGRRFSTRDLAEAEEFARRAGTAIERARLYQREHEVAETLQRSLLPERLPTVTGLRMAARYVAGSEGMAVGGDWYDVVHLPDGTVMVVVGDVMGRGVRAATLMGQLRDAVRIFTFEGSRPEAVAARVNDYAMAFGSDLATFVCGLIDPRRRTFRFTRAGHPPPLLLTAGGETEFLERAGSVPIGVFSDAVFDEAEVVLEPGATLLLYTDGLVEHPPATMDAGFARLRAVAAAAATAADDPEDMADAVLDGTVGAARHRDDVALLVVRVTV